MPLFTFILEYDGFTGVSQARAGDVHSALQIWARNIASQHSQELPKNVEKISSLLVLDTPVAVQTVKNIWCLSASADSKLALLNIVQTAE
jgi:hypothetical protein